jgi:hypothetical protein
MPTDRSGWSGEGEFTIRLIECLEQVEEIALLRVEDAPASRSGTGFVLLANDIFVGFAAERRSTWARLLGVFRRARHARAPRLTLAGLDARLAAIASIGEADYADEAMLQYLRTERIVPPYQTRGYKQVELVRVYEVKEFRPSDRD